MDLTSLRLGCIKSFYVNTKNTFVEHVYNTLSGSCENFKIAYFTLSVMRNTIVFPARSRFPVKLICCVTF